MEMWTEVRRKVLVEGASKRSIRRDYKLSAEVLEKILTHPEPPGYRQSVTPPKPQLGKFSVSSTRSWNRTRPHRPSSDTPPSGSSNACETNTDTPDAPLRSVPP
jgi:hypothetical protein